MKTVIYATLFNLPKTQNWYVVVFYEEDEKPEIFGPMFIEEAKNFFNEMFGKI